MSLSRSGRRIVYTNQTPFETDTLYSNLYNMVNSSYLAAAILGTGISNATLVAGLPCTQNTVPDLSVLIGAGVMFNFEQFDATAYGVIPPDTATTDKLYKPYIQTTQFGSLTNTAVSNLIGLPLTFTVPGSGTTNYLLQATFLTVDTDSASRPYGTPGNPTAPAIYNTAPQTRWDTIFYSLKSATSPTIPTPDAGYVGLYAIAVAAGVTQILNSNITVYSGAPFITESLTQKISQATADTRYLSSATLQAATPIYGADTGTANAYAVTATPAYGSVVAGTFVFVKAAHTNTAASTLEISGLGSPVSILISTPVGLVALVGDEIQAGVIYKLQFDGTNFQLQNPSMAPSVTASVGLTTSQALSGAAGASTKVSFDTVYFDRFSMWNTTNHQFVAPVKGKYVISSSMTVAIGSSSGSSLQIDAWVNGARDTIMSYNNFNGAANDGGVAASVTFELNAGDTVAINVYFDSGAPSPSAAGSVGGVPLCNASFTLSGN